MSTTPQPVVLITSASSGLGHATAALLAASGYRVFGASRAPRPDPTLPYAMLSLDVRSDESVQCCVEAVLEAAGRVDVLVNNAGVGLAGALEEAALAQAQSLSDARVITMTKRALPEPLAEALGRLLFHLDDRPAPEALLTAALRLLGVGCAPGR